MNIQRVNFFDIVPYRLHCRVDLCARVVKRGKRCLDLVLLCVKEMDIRYVHGICCQGACFVQADDIDPCERFNAVHFIDKHLFACQADDGYRQNRTGEQNHTAGNHSDQCGNRSDDR